MSEGTIIVSTRTFQVSDRVKLACDTNSIAGTVEEDFGTGRHLVVWDNGRPGFYHESELRPAGSTA